MSITTRRGDDGETDLLGARVGKDHVLIELVGQLDELNAQLGATAVLLRAARHLEIVHDVQGQLFVLGTETAALPSQARERLPHLVPGDLARLDAACAELEAALPPLTTFILPGGSAAGAAAHLARTICRRVERRFRTALPANAGLASALPFLNRLSDLLFLLARDANRTDGAGETVWKGTGS